MNEDALSGRALDEAIALAMGWTFYARNPGKDAWYATHDGTYRNQHLPPFSASLDALSAGPERLLREAGVAYIGSFHVSTGTYEATWVTPNALTAAVHVSAHGTAETEPLARARAALAALRVLATESEEAKG